MPCAVLSKRTMHAMPGTDLAHGATGLPYPRHWHPQERHERYPKSAILLCHVLYCVCYHPTRCPLLGLLSYLHPPVLSWCTFGPFP
eukprot:1307960-Rhodomonas_salina.1